MKNITTLILSLTLLMTISIWGKQEARLLRFPDIGDKLITFVYAGDIWTVDKDGGEARHLTSHKGFELFPKISPDGKMIAFSAEYSGSRQIYVIPSEGGTPKQLTFYNDVGPMPPRGGYDNIVLDWTPDSKKILFRSNRTPFGKRMGKYFLINVEGGAAEELPIPEAGFGGFSPDGKKICYTPISREFRTWKRYKGGRAADVWIYDLEKKNSRRITKFPGTDQTPVWHKESIYFMSDRDLKLNVHKYNTVTGKIDQVTRHKDFDALWLSGRKGSFVYELGGYIYKLNPETGETTKVTIEINYDNPNKIPYLKKVKKDIDSFGISPDGKTAIFCARGDIFTVPAEGGVTINLTNSPTRELSPSYSNNGKYLAYTSDKTGEYEIYVKDLGTGKVKQITRNSKRWINAPVWSPDDSRLLYTDMTRQLKMVDVKTGAVKIVAKASYSNINSYSFSSDSRWILYTSSSKNQNRSIWIYSINSGANRRISHHHFDDNSPVFSDCGKYIFFNSNRDFNLTRSGFESTYLYTNPNRIYAIYLTKNSPPIFSKEAKPKASTKTKSKASKKKGTKIVKPVNIDFEGIVDRVVAISKKNLYASNITAIPGGFLYRNYEGLKKFSLKDQKTKTLIKKALNFDVAANGKKLIYLAKGHSFGVTGIAVSKVGDGSLGLAGLQMKIDPVKEWQQIYDDAFRIYRDWFYVDNLHNIDWKEVYKRYSQLLPHVAHRADLDYILGEVIGETNAGHAYVAWGDFEKVKRVNNGLLGAELTPDFKARKYKISKIYKGENWKSSRRSPLTAQGVNVKEGDYILSIDEVPLTTSVNPYTILEGKANKKVKISVSSLPNGQNPRHYYVKTIKSEQELRYFDWVNSRREMVDKLSGGRIGYIHVPNTSIEGNRELFRGMYAYHNKEALIIDDRYNGGGFIPDNMVRLLQRKTKSYWARQGLSPSKTPGVSHDGPKAMLINHYSSSGGDCFPYYFRQLNLGKIIGTRTWGGLIGISYNAYFIDGGRLHVPCFGIYDTKGKWIVEGVGIYPDIEVYDTPHKIAEGKDPSIEKAIEVLLEELKKRPAKKLKQPLPPNRSGWIEEDIK